MTIVLNGTSGITNVDGTAAAPALTGSDTDTGIFFPAANTLAFSTAGTEDARFDSSGNLGIGTSSPVEKLTVAGSVSSSSEFVIKSGTTAKFALGQTSDAFYIYSNASGTERMRITSGGDVGIGTSSPNTKLQVNGNAVIGNGTIGAPASGYQLRVTNDGSEYYDFGRSSSTGYFTINASQASPYRGFIWAYGGTSQMTLDSSGNLGLGVTPSAWYTGYTAQNIGYSGAIWSNRTSSDTNTVMVGLNSYLNSGATNWIYQNNGNASRYVQVNGQHQWHTAASGTAGNAITFTQALTLDASGNLSLGTTSTTVWNGSAGTKVVVGGSGNTITSLQSSTTTVDQGAIFEGYATGISSNSAALGSIAFLRSNTSTTALSSYTAFYTNNAGTVAERARIDSSGNLLVGTTSSDARLNVKGSGSTSSTFSLIVRNSASGDIVKTRDDGYVYLPSTYNNTSASAANIFMGGSGELYRSTSSLKYKTNVQDATHGLADLLKLRSVTYQGKSEADAGKTFGGLIAEEVDAAGLTEFVQYAEDGSPDALAYGNMVSLCIKAIQEQQAIIESLKADVAALKGNT